MIEHSTTYNPRVNNVSKLRYILQEGGFTQAQLAERLDVSLMTINSWVNNRSSPRRRHAEGIADLYVEVTTSVERNLFGAAPELSHNQIAALAAGEGGVDVIVALAQSRYRRSIRQLESLRQHVADHLPADVEAVMDSAVRAGPDAYRELLLHPYVATLIERSEEIWKRDPGSRAAGELLEEMSWVAASAGVLCETPDFQLDVPIIDGTLYLPGLGTLICHAAPAGRSTAKFIRSAGRCLLRFDQQSFDLPDDLSTGTPDWAPVRVVKCRSNNVELRVVIDDAIVHRVEHSSLRYPFRARRLDEFDFKNWKVMLEDAWELLAENCSADVATIASGLRMIIPIDAGAYHASGFYRSGFGAVTGTITASPERLAQTLLEEFQRMKLNALNELSPLRNDNGEAGYFAPWSSVPAALGGLLEGYYSLASAADFWSDRMSHAVGESQFAAAVAFGFRRVWEESVYERLRVNQNLTDLGRQVVTSIHEKCRSMGDISGKVADFTRESSIDRWMAFRLVNLRCSDHDLELMSQAWKAGMPCPVTNPIVTEIKACPVALSGWKLREQLAEIRAIHPEKFEDVLTNEHFRTLLVPGSSEADALAVARRAEEATSAYLAEIKSSPESVESWAGLASVVNQTGESHSLSLGRFPEVVFTLWQHLRLQRGVEAHPLRLARWLEPLLIRSDDFAFEQSPNR